MIIYNITIKIDPEVEADWMQWMIEEHIPAVMATGFFTQYSFQKILQSIDPANTYAIQYFLESSKELHQYQVQHSKRLQGEHSERYKDKFVAIRTLLEVLQESSRQ